MLRKVLRSRYVPVFLICGTLLVSAAVAQTFPLIRNAVQGQGSDASTSPTPANTPPATAAGRHQPRGRDLSRYDKVGPLTLGAGPNRAAAMAQVRAFLLTHWQGRRHGRLSVSLTDREGRQVANDFYVEPDGDGRWGVVLETPAGAETFRVVEEVEMPEDGPPVLGGEHGKRRGRPAGKGLHLKQSEDSHSGLVL